ncbi:MAG: DrmB family protein [Ruminococcus sp.]
MPKPTFRKKAKDDDSSIAKFSNEKISVGDIRKTQMITTFGVGSIVDFKDDTVIIASIDDWDHNPNDIEEVENRKIFNENLSVITGVEYFLMPRTTQSTNSFSKGKNIPSYIFPEKLHCSKCGNIYDFRELDIKDRHRCPQCRNNLTASRFIVVCAKGHMDDFPYDWWVHNGKPCPSGVKSPRIRMVNIYNRTDIDSLRLECTECKATRSMVQVFSENALSEFQCTCKHPHFKDPYARVQYGCHDKMRVRLRSASGVYFPITKSALLIPPWSKKVVNCIQKNYGILKAVEEDKIVYAIRQVIHDKSVSDEEIMRSWNAVKISMEQKRKRSELSVYEDEYAILSKDENENEDNFSSYSSSIPQKYKQFFEQLAVVDRLTVTQAFTGFTRITRNETNSVAISQYPKPWLPAVELTGEGIFIRFNKDRVTQWRNTNSSRYRRMKKAMEDSKFVLDSFSETYVMLHTFAHLFIREITNICGYSAASIREKIYSEIDDKNEVKMCGVLIYVSSSDSDSSLGGLISIADNKDVFEEIIDSMLERASWCSGDPLCISSMKQGYKNLNYAACHDCTLLPETSCERFNCFLDRASIVGLPDNPDLGFFK